MAELSRGFVLLVALAIPSVTLFGCGGGGPDATTTTTTTPGVCAPAMKGVDCLGYDLENGQHYDIAHSETCCQICADRPDCGAWTHVGQEHACYLKRWCDYLVKEPKDSNATLTSSMPTKLPATPEPTCAVPDLGIGYKCEGEDDGKFPAPTSEKCCNICMNTTGCLIYSWQNSTKTCFLKKNCPLKPADPDYITGWSPPKNLGAAKKRYQVGRGIYPLEGYLCGSGDKSTVIYYPKGKGPFHVVVYGHGAWGYVDGSDDWLETVASMGLIVVAPFQGKDPKPCKSNFTLDLLNALEGSRLGGAALHPALASADFSRTGIFGHSKGAKYAPEAASRGAESHNVKAVVGSCDVPKKHPEVEVPSMFTTGSLDKSNTNDVARKYYEKSKAVPRVYVNLMDAYHMEVQEGKRLNVLAAQFLSCHVAQNAGDCKVLYEDGPDSVCNINSYLDCMVTPASGTTQYIHHTTMTTTTAAATCFPLDAAQGTWCTVATDAKRKAVDDAVKYICNTGIVNCSGCPEDRVFNSYFQMHLDQGNQACNFGGSGDLIQPEGSPCELKATDGYVCRAKADATAANLSTGLGYVCGNGVDCEPINAGGICVYPAKKDLLDKTSWAFNQWYKGHASDGARSCDFGGTAELVSANNTAEMHQQTELAV